MTEPTTSSEQFTRRRIRMSELDWPVVIGIVLMHLGCAAAPFVFSWSALAVMVVLCWLTGAVGIALCYHRLLTHRSFKTPKWFEYILTGIGCLAWQGGPVQWVGTHRIHHKHSDQELDPHTPKHGFTWAHMLWCMHKDHKDRPSAARDLQQDRGMQFLNNYFWMVQFVLAIGLFAGGELAGRLGLGTSGWSWFVWGICVRTVVVYHTTWFVNSASHTWGYRTYDTDDHSTNLWWVALLSSGEGWHNNHHSDQRAAAHGRRWFELDLTYWTIRLLSCVGLARDIVTTRPL